MCKTISQLEGYGSIYAFPLIFFSLQIQVAPGVLFFPPFISPFGDSRHIVNSRPSPFILCINYQYIFYPNKKKEFELKSSYNVKILPKVIGLSLVYPTPHPESKENINQTNVQAHVTRHDIRIPYRCVCVCVGWGCG